MERPRALWIAPSPRLPPGRHCLALHRHGPARRHLDQRRVGTPAPVQPCRGTVDQLGQTISWLHLAARPAWLGSESKRPVHPCCDRGVSPNPQHEGVALSGIRFVVTDPSALDPIALAVEVLVTFQRLAPEGSSIIVDPASFDLVAGSANSGPDRARRHSSADPDSMADHSPNSSSFGTRCCCTSSRQAV